MTLRYGDRSQEVRQLQRRLNTWAGANLYEDGHFGAATEDAVRAFQRSHGLVADGIAGPKTLAALGGADCSHLLQNADLVAAGARLGLPLATIYAVNQVESNGQGFLSNGKPAILFERHIMYRRLAAHDQVTADQLAAQFPALVNPRPGGYAGGTAEHQRLANARQIDDTAALESASWGAFQIMGFHWQRLGYISVQAFAEAMGRSESAQFEAFVRFIDTDPALHKALKARKWADFARLYNGPDYKRNLYDVKLEHAYKQHTEAHKETI
ncbi:TPA: N-acetylmuramidase domain-containing protein [Pseudomonas aeruginosa]